MLIVGSYALRHHGLTTRRPTDIDIICPRGQKDGLVRNVNQISERAYKLSDGTIIDIEVINDNVGTPESSAQMYDWSCSLDSMDKTVYVPELSFHTYIAPPAVLYSMKRSHRHRPKAWQKHIADYHLLKAHVNNVDIYAPITRKRESEYPPLKTPSLDKTVDDFFKDKVSNRIFIHDEIHQVMAHRAQPMYTYIRLTADRVTCAREKWELLPFDDKVKCVLEEAYVIALERGVIPMLYAGGPVVTPEDALSWGLMRICTTLCSGWFRDFATENYPAIVASADNAYHERFLAAVDNRDISRISKV